MPWYANHTLNTFIPKTDRLNRFDQYLVPNFFFDVKTFLAALIVPINMATCDALYLWCDWLLDCQIDHIGLFVGGRFLFPPSYTSVRPPFLCQYPSKNEVPHVPIHPNKSTQHQICPVYWPSQQSTHISLILELYVRQLRHRTFPCCCLDNANEAESMLPQFFSSRNWCKVWVCANDRVRVSPWHHKFLQKISPWGRLSSSSCCSSSLFSDLKILSPIVIPNRPHAAFWISAPFSGFLSIATYIGKPKLIQWPPCTYHRDMYSSVHIRS